MTNGNSGIRNPQHYEDPGTQSWNHRQLFRQRTLIVEVRTYTNVRLKKYTVLRFCGFVHGFRFFGFSRAGGFFGRQRFGHWPKGRPKYSSAMASFSAFSAFRPVFGLSASIRSRFWPFGQLSVRFRSRFWPLCQLSARF